MGRQLRVSPIPPQEGQPLAEWLRETADALNAIPSFSIFSTSDGPNDSGITGDVGTLGIDIGSSNTVGWLNTSGTTSGWEELRVGLNRLSLGTAELSAHGLADVDILGLRAAFDSSATTKHQIVGYFHARQRVATTGSIQGIEGYTIAEHPSGTVDLALGVPGNIEHAGAGVLDEARGFQTNLVFSGNGSANTRVGFYADNPADIGGGSGSLGTNIAFFAPAQTYGDENYGVYLEGSGTTNYLEGEIQSRNTRGGGSQNIVLDHDAGTPALVAAALDGTRHWRWGSEGDADDDWGLFAYNNSGVFQHTSIKADRDTKQVTISDLTSSVMTVSELAFSKITAVDNGNNFSAEFYLEVRDKAGNKFYLSASTTTW